MTPFITQGHINGKKETIKTIYRPTAPGMF